MNSEIFYQSIDTSNFVVQNNESLNCSRINYDDFVSTTGSFKTNISIIQETMNISLSLLLCPYMECV